MEEKKVLLSIKELDKFFPLKKESLFGGERRFVRANEDISLDIYEGETLGLVGESGCGKSTLGRTAIHLYPASAGAVSYRGRSIYEFQPAYVRKILANLPGEMKAAVRQLEKEDGKRDARFYALAGLCGGLLLSSDAEAVRQALSNAYEAGVKAAAAGAGEAAQAAFAMAKEAVERLKEPLQREPRFAWLEGLREEGLILDCLSKEEMRRLRKELQIIFQDPYSSLDARMTISQIIGEGLLTHSMYAKNSEEMQQYIVQVMEECGLAPYFLHRYPHQFSGGQRQRVGIARSLALKPRFVVCDEAVSALDVSIQSQIINLLIDLKRKENLTYLFISHNLSVVKYISDRICVMYLGRMVELAATERLFAHPMHPYTRGLLEAIPSTTGRQEEASLLEGDIPSPVNPPKGCRFHTRCPYCTGECRETPPALEEVEPGHFVACHHRL